MVDTHLILTRTEIGSRDKRDLPHEDGAARDVLGRHDAAANLRTHAQLDAATALGRKEDTNQGQF